MMPGLLGLLLTAAGTQAQPVLTNAAQLRALTVEEARLEHPVKLRAVVTVIGGDLSATIFMQDETGGSFIAGTRSGRGLEPGSHIEVTGKTYAGLFVPGVRASNIRLLGW